MKIWGGTPYNVLGIFLRFMCLKYHTCVFVQASASVTARLSHPGFVSKNKHIESNTLNQNAKKEKKTGKL